MFQGMAPGCLSFGVQTAASQLCTCQMPKIIVALTQAGGNLCTSQCLWAASGSAQKPLPSASGQAVATCRRVPGLVTVRTGRQG